MAKSITTRQREILTAVVDSYIATGEPISSGVLAQTIFANTLSSATIRNEMAALRAGGSVQIQARLERARREGDLPAHADPAALTGFIVSLMNGMAVQASNGLDRAALNRVIDLAMTAWPAKLN